MTHDPVDGRRRELIGRLAAVLGHAQETLDALLVEDPADEQRPDFFTRTKLVAETSLLLYAAARADTGGLLERRLDELRRSLRGPARGGDVLAWTHLRPSIIPELTVAHWVLTALGDPDPRFDDALAGAQRQCSVGLLERLPWKGLERSWHHELGAPGARPLPEAVHTLTSLAERGDALFATREEVYAFTHALIYHTDFGHRLPPTPRPVTELLEDAGSSLARCLDDDDFDLGAEVLFTWPYLRRPWDATSAFGLHVLLAVDREVGILPSMTLRAQHYDGLDEARRRTYFFAETYHTVYVLGLLISALLAPGVQAGPPLAQDAARAGEADRMIALLLPPEAPRQWEARLALLTPAQRGALLPLLTDVAARRAVRAADYGRLREVLVAHLDSGVAPTPCVVQSAELLARLAGLPRGERCDCGR